MWRDFAIAAGLLALGLVLHQTGRARDRNWPDYEIDPETDMIGKRTARGGRDGRDT